MPQPPYKLEELDQAEARTLGLMEELKRNRREAITLHNSIMEELDAKYIRLVIELVTIRSMAAGNKNNTALLRQADKGAT